MEIKDYIKKQFSEHKHYADSFAKADSAFCAEYYHPRTQKRITWSQVCNLIQDDMERRANRIIEKCKDKH